MKRQMLWIIMVIVLAGAAMAAIGSSEKKGAHDGHDHEGHAHEGAGDGHNHGRLGPHGGKILTEGSFELEVVIDETGGASYFRLYPSCDHKPVNPREIKAEVQTDRLGDRSSVFNFRPVNNFLLSSEPVDLPHSFFLKVKAEWKKEEFEWEYSHYDGRLTLEAEIAERMGLIAESAGPGVIKSTIRLPGEVTFDADKLSHVVPRVPGVVLEIAKNLGDKVNKDEIIAIIDSRELGEARSKYLVALEREKLASYNFERAERLYKIEAVPEKELLTAKKAYLEEKIERDSAARKLITMGMSDKDVEALEGAPNTDLTRYAIRAPFDGVVVKKHIAPGEWVKEDAEIYIVADLKEVWVDITVYAGDLNSVFVGQKALVKSESAGLETLAGEVSYVGPIMGEESRTAKARIVIANVEGKWRPGLFAAVELIREQTTAAIVVRNDALQEHKGRQVVFVAHDDQYEAQPVQVGRSDGVHTEIIKGLTAGDKYVAAKAFILKAELGKSAMSHQH